MTWETLDRARRLLGAHHLPTCPEDWLPGISCTVMVQTPWLFKAPLSRLTSHSRAALYLARGRQTHVHGHLCVLSYNILVKSLVLEGVA